jgi:hypothetical protein
LQSKLVTDIKEEDEQLNLATSAGNLITNQKATVPGYGKVWSKEDAMTNVFSLANMEKGHHITYDLAKESAFVVHTHKGPLRFEKGPENLYYFKPKHLMRTVEAQVVQTVRENMSFYTERQIERAKQAQDLLHALGCPTVYDLKAIIQMNTIANCPV